jgi:hypothetical protein
MDILASEGGVIESLRTVQALDLSDLIELTRIRGEAGKKSYGER